VPVDGCPLFSPAASVALPPVRELIDGSGLAPYDPATGKGTLKRLVLREAKGTGELMVHLIAASDISRHLAGLRERLPRALPRLRSIYATEGAGPRLLWGKPAIDELLSGLLLRVYPLSFLQPNPRTAERLYERIKAVAGITGGERVLGLYCGAGSIELFLGRYVKEVVGIDSSGESIACARENAVLNKSGNCLFLEEKAERAARRLRPGKVDLLVVDPPRKGMTGQTLAAVNEIRPERMIYVSCNPSTLARDLKELRRTYRAGTIIPFDFFPHTAHFEVLTLLERTGPAR
jgi:23S rRNA (uracil-5-)-methyltransferase RumA